jgi:hypothetical protein
VLEKVRFHYNETHVSQIYCPNQVVISGSNNGTDYVTLGTFVKTTNWATSEAAAVFWSSDLVISGFYRYVKCVFTYQAYLLFLSEIEIYGEFLGDSLCSQGKTYTETAPLVPYPDTGGIELTDGKIALLAYLDANWVGWYQVNPVIVVDLGEITNISKVRFHYSETHQSQIYCPNQLVISGSCDDVTYITLGTFVKTTNWATSSIPAIFWSNFLAVCGLCRYVKFAFTYQQYCIFLSEVEVYGTELALSGVNQFIYDRTALDITNRTAKAFFNVVDWKRINNNIKFLDAQLFRFTGVPVVYTAVTVPTVNTFPTAAEINTFLENLNAVIVAFSSYVSGLSEVGHTWGDGNVKALSWSNVNDWEHNLSLMMAYFTPRKHIVGIACCGVNLTRNNGFRR